MANIQERRNKDGKLISYSIRVHRGRGADGRQLKPWTATFDVSPTWTEKSARKKAEAFAATFEKECREGVTTDSVTTWLSRFSKRHGLPHVNAHAFRHTMASMLYFNGVDSVSISKRLGHAQVSTTANIYAHVMEAADKKNADILADVFLKKA